MRRRSNIMIIIYSRLIRAMIMVTRIRRVGNHVIHHRVQRRTINMTILSSRSLTNTITLRPTRTIISIRRRNVLIMGIRLTHVMRTNLYTLNKLTQHDSVPSNRPILRVMPNSNIQLNVPNTHLKMINTMRIFHHLREVHATIGKHRTLHFTGLLMNMMDPRHHPIIINTVMRVLILIHPRHVNSTRGLRHQRHHLHFISPPFLIRLKHDRKRNFQMRRKNQQRRRRTRLTKMALTRQLRHHRVLIPSPLFNKRGTMTPNGRPILPPRRSTTTLNLLRRNHLDRTLRTSPLIPPRSLVLRVFNVIHGVIIRPVRQRNHRFKPLNRNNIFRLTMNTI